MVEVVAESKEMVEANNMLEKEIRNNYSICFLGVRSIIDGKIVDPTLVFKLFVGNHDAYAEVGCPLKEYFIVVSADLKQAKIIPKL